MQSKNITIRLYYTALLDVFYDGDPDRYNWDETRSNIVAVLSEAGFREAESLRDDEIILSVTAGEEATIRTRIEAVLQRNSLPVPDGIAIESE